MLDARTSCYHPDLVFVLGAATQSLRSPVLILQATKDSVGSGPEEPLRMQRVKGIY